MQDKIKVYRYRISPFVVNFPTPTGVQSYKFTGSKKNREEYKMLPLEVVQWLQLSTSTFYDGELVIETEGIEEIEELYIDEVDLVEYENNTHTRTEVEDILKGNFLQMKSELNKITSDSEKRFVIDIAKEMKIDSVGKRKFLAELIGIDVEFLFADDGE